MREMGKLSGDICKRIMVLTIFSIAMGFLESAVVVYLRQIYYPEGFIFPLKPMPQSALGIEVLRELSTIIMLGAVGIIAGRNSGERFSFFLYCFGVWDIFYYAWLKVLLNWPPSLLTWDILFLIPVVWAGPVLAPVIVSLTMILFAGAILRAQGRGLPVRMTQFEWALMLLGGSIIFVAFVWDYAGIIIRASGAGIPALEQKIRSAVAMHVPTHFQWPLFMLGEVLLFGALCLSAKRTKEERREAKSDIL